MRICIEGFAVNGVLRKGSANMASDLIRSSYRRGMFRLSYSGTPVGFRWGVKGVSRGGSFYTASHTAFMERCGYRLNNSKVQVGGMLGFR